MWPPSKLDGKPVPGYNGPGWRTDEDEIASCTTTFISEMRVEPKASNRVFTFALERQYEGNTRGRVPDVE